MSVLAAFVGGWGHAEPLLPIAALAVEGGHTVTFAGQRAVVPQLAARGFSTVIVGPDTLSSVRRPLVPVDREMEAMVAREHFVRSFGAERAKHLGRLIDRDRPDVVVCDEMDAGAVIAAESAHIPCITVSVLAAGRLASHHIVGPAWDQLRAENALPDDRIGARFAGTLRVTPAPRSFRHPEGSTPFDLHHIRPPILDHVDRSDLRPAPPQVYATLGTVFDVESGDLFTRLVQALSMLDVDSLLTTGAHIARAELPTTPPHVTVAAFVAQQRVLPRCSAVVCHGGSGTLIAALSLGIPVVVIPMGADQPDNADRCHDLGVGIVLDAITAQPAEIVAAVQRVLTDETYSEAARTLAAEAAAQPALHLEPHVLELLRSG